MTIEDEPVPVRQCPVCHGTIWRRNVFYQCPDCGCRSTEYGGIFPTVLDSDGKGGGPSPTFVKAVNAAKARLNGVVPEQDEDPVPLTQAKKPGNEQNYLKLHKKRF